MKDWFKGRGGGTGAASEDYNVDELIVLRRFDDARAILEKKIKVNSRDLHARTKLAEVFAHQRRGDKAVEQYAYVADAYAQDGFFDKGIALLTRAARLAPADPAIPARLDKLRRGKDLARTRTLAVDSLKQADAQRSGYGATAAVELEQIWERLSTSRLVQRLPPEQIKRIFAAVEIERVQAGTMVAKSGQALPEMFIIATGVIEATIPSAEGRQVSVRSFSSGDMIGESALLEHLNWPADYRVAESGTVLRLTRESLERAMLGNSDPRQLLDALREQHSDRDVRAALRQLGSA